MSIKVFIYISYILSHFDRCTKMKYYGYLKVLKIHDMCLYRSLINLGKLPQLSKWKAQMIFRGLDETVFDIFLRNSPLQIIKWNSLSPVVSSQAQNDVGFIYGHIFAQRFFWGIVGNPRELFEF